MENADPLGEGDIFVKKPIAIRAKQWFTHGDHPDVTRSDTLDTHEGWIKTLEGGHIVTPGDWIITGVKGETYPCKPDIFAATYDEVKS